MVKQIGRNDACWCGSGKKYKKCHLDRSEQEAVPLGRILRGFREAQPEVCLHPSASVGACSGRAIKAHTVPRASLYKIARDGHVYGISGDIPTLIRTDGQFTAELIGVNKASVFTGFCSYHDSSTFSPFENGTYSSIEEAAFVLAYRAVCVEFYKKAASLGLDFLRLGIDKGRSIEDQVAIHSIFGGFDEGAKASLRDLRMHKHRFDGCLLAQNFSNVKYAVFELGGPPPVMCSGAIFPEFDFFGNRLQDMSNLALRADIVAFSAISNGDKGWILYSWLGESRPVEVLVNSLLDLKEQYEDSILRFIFASFENTYISPAWWDSLSKENQRALLERMRDGADPMEARKSTYLSDDGLRMAKWDIREVKTNFKR